MKSLFFILFLLAGSVKGPAQMNSESLDSFKNRQLTPAEMQADFRFLRQALEETHPGLYRYHSRQEMRQEMDGIYAQLGQPMPYYDYYRLLAGLIAYIRCAHTTILPQDLQALSERCRVFPFGVVYIGTRVYLLQNMSTDTVVKPGFELLSVNGRSIDSINAILFRHIWSDGYNQTWKTRMLADAKFALFYYLDVEQPDHFDITCRDSNGQILQREVSPVLMSDFDKNIRKNPTNAHLLAVYGPRSALNRKEPWRLELHKDKNAAVITLRNFGGAANAEKAAQKMHDFLEASISKMAKQKIDNLIIDLRDNAGGWDHLGQILYTYLIDTPSYYYARQHTITDSSGFLQYSSVSKDEQRNLKNELIQESDGTFTVKEQYNYTLSKQYPQKDRFSGKVYFLVNGGCASATSEFTALAYSHHLGIFVGEETGGNYTGGNAGEFLHLTLPATGIRVRTPLVYCENAVQPPIEKGRGTIPDYEVPYNIKDVVSGTDTQLNFVYGLIPH